MDALHSGYVKHWSRWLPRQGNKAPWKVSMDYWIDREELLHQPIEDGRLVFDRAAPVAPVPSELAHA